MAHAVACVIPARWASTRFPGKLLHPLLGIPLIVHTLTRAREAGCFSEIVCLTDSPQIADVARAAGFTAVLTGEAANGTERIAKNLAALQAELIVDLQGDEPAFPVEGLRAIHAGLSRNPEWAHVLVRAEAPTPEEAANPNRVKAALDVQGRVLDFFRAPVHAGPGVPAAIRLQMGVYGYSRNFLGRYAATPVSPREISESHELLRDLELAPIVAHPCSRVGQAVDVPQDLEPAARLLRRDGETPPVRVSGAPGRFPQDLPVGAERMTIIDPNQARRAPSPTARRH